MHSSPPISAVHSLYLSNSKVLGNSVGGLGAKTHHEIIKLPDTMAHCIATNGGSKFQAQIIWMFNSLLLFNFYVLFFSLVL